MRNKLIIPKRPEIQMDNLDFKNRNFVQRQIYTKGFSYKSQAGVTNSEAPQLGGKARFLHGVCFYGDFNFPIDRDIWSLTVNQEIIVDKVIWWNYNPQGQAGNFFKTEQFFALPRPLSGSDSVMSQLTTINSHDYDIVFFLSDK